MNDYYEGSELLAKGQIGCFFYRSYIKGAIAT